MMYQFDPFFWMILSVPKNLCGRILIFHTYNFAHKLITWHELSHLLDEKQKNTSQSEVKAFLTELVYGKNPQDVLWQLKHQLIQI